MRQKSKFLAVLAVLSLVAVMVFALAPLAVRHQASAAPLKATVGQYGPNPIVFNQTVTTDNIQYLMAAASEHPDNITLNMNSFPKHFWFNNFGANSADYLKWYISVPTAANYHVLAVLQASSGVGFRLTESSGAVLNFTISNGDFTKQDAGVIALPAGSSTLTLIRTSTGGTNIKSLELIRDSDYAAYNSRVASKRANTTWFSDAGYGLFFQEGAWSYPRSGAYRDPETQANGFNVPAFVSMVQNTGASYVIWSFSWYTYQPYAPISQIDTIFGNTNMTTQRDVIGELATALHAQGIKFFLYYHRGEPASSMPWFQSGVFDANFSPRGAGTRTTFFNNWESVVTAVGNRYGTNLDGWFLDDGVVYYPAAFEHLQDVLRAGNSNRLISWNNWVGPRVTDFEDVMMGEGHRSENITGSSTNGTGILTAGPNKGELEHGMFMMNSDWGVHYANQTTGGPGFTAQNAADWVCAGKAKGEPLSFNLMMWDGGTQPDLDSATLNLLVSMKGLVASQCGGGPTPTRTSTPIGGSTYYNNTDAGITYTGAWSVSSGRGYGDYMDDVRYTTTNGDSASFTFTGTSIDFLTEKNSDEGNVEVYIDNVSQGQFNANAATRSAQVALYSTTSLTNATHTIKVTKRSGSYMLVDAFRQPGGGPTPTRTNTPGPTSTPTRTPTPGGSPTMINNDNAGIAYTGTWTFSGNRGAGDYLNDVKYTSNVNDFFQYTFTGTGVDFIGPKGSGYAVVQVFIDSVSKGNFSEDNGGAYAPQQVIYSITGLASGSHTIKVVKVSGSYHQLDALRIYP